MIFTEKKYYKKTKPKKSLKTKIDHLKRSWTFIKNKKTGNWDTNY